MKVIMNLISPLANVFTVFIACFIIVQANPSNLARSDGGDSPLDDSEFKRAPEHRPRPHPPFVHHQTFWKRRVWDNETWNSFKSEVKETFDEIHDIVDSGVSRIKQGWEKFKDFYLRKQEKSGYNGRPPTDIVFRRAEGRRGVFDDSWAAIKTGFKQGVEDAEAFGKDAAERAKQGWERFKSIFLKRDLEDEIFSQRFADNVFDPNRPRKGRPFMSR